MRPLQRGKGVVSERELEGPPDVPPFVERIELPAVRLRNELVGGRNEMPPRARNQATSAGDAFFRRFWSQLTVLNKMPILTELTN